MNKQSKSKPLVSICIPVYNTERYIGEAIESSQNQTYKNIEIIIVDNKSTDNTFKIIKKFQKKDNRIKLFQNKENIGMYPNFNETIKHSKGKFIKFLCADDILKPRCVERMVKPLIDDSSISLVCTNSDRISTDRKIIEEIEIPLAKEKKYSGKKVAKKALRLSINICGTPSHVLFRKYPNIFFDTFIESGWGNDMEMWARLFGKGDVFVIKENLISDRRHYESATSEITAHSSQIDDLYKSIMLIKQKAAVKYNMFDTIIMKSFFVGNILFIRSVERSYKRSFFKKNKLRKFLIPGFFCFLVLFGYFRILKNLVRLIKGQTESKI